MPGKKGGGKAFRFRSRWMDKGGGESGELESLPIVEGTFCDSAKTSAIQQQRKQHLLPSDAAKRSRSVPWSAERIASRDSG